MKRVPQRMCIACRVVRPKRSLVRVVRAPEGGVGVDETGKANGRGAYLCRSRLCWQRALGDRRRRSDGRLGAALNTTLSDQEWDTLWGYAQLLPDAVDGETDASAGQVEGES